MRFPSYRLAAVPLLLLSLAAVPAGAQCLLANPSFEMRGSAGAIFAGWNQFGSVGWSSVAAHGALAARVSGPNTGGWDVSGYWQRLDTSPGRRWTASVTARHDPARPLTGSSRAILNIEWRDGSGNLISYESHTVADASTPAGADLRFSVTSAAAPAGTAAAHLLLGVLQSPTDPVPDVYYDQATFDDAGPPTLDALQWPDFPGGRTLEFAGRTWRVKGPGYYGPGPNLFCDTAACTWTDLEGSLHLTIQRLGGSWYSTEVVLDEALGYGDYVFTTRGRLDALHPNVVLGIFLWQYGPCWEAENSWWNPYNEIDIEYSHWGNPANPVGQFVAQPYDYPGNIQRYAATFADGEITSHAFRWLPDRVEFRSWRGDAQAESAGSLIRAWTYRGPHLPRPEQPRVHLNLWQFNGPPSTTQEVVFPGFAFVPACSEPPCLVDAPAGPPSGGSTLLGAARPNPFRGGTALRYTLGAPGRVEIAIHDVAGRRVRTLVREERPAGSHEAFWDGLDDGGGRVASGVYLVRLRAGARTESRTLVLLR